MASLPPARILIADDEPEILDLIRQLLVQRGYEVATASSGEEALQAVPAFRPDVLLVDMAMPGLSGAEVLAALRQQGVGIPVIAISGLATATTGFFARLEKPSASRGWPRPSPRRSPRRAAAPEPRHSGRARLAALRARGTMAPPEHIESGLSRSGPG